MSIFDGGKYVMRHFQNARLARHLEATNMQFSIQVGLLGVTALRDRGWLK
jgi:hypothetical protein